MYNKTSFKKNQMSASQIIIQIAVVIFSAVIHEYAHGAAAERLGDKTPRMAGRMTLNPLKHLDPFGSIIVPFILYLLPTNFIIAWAKPVPVNPLNFRDKKYGSAKVALAGPSSNIALALFFGLLLRFFPFGDSLFYQNLQFVFGSIVFINLLLALFNLTPVPPFDGSHILFAFLKSYKAKLFLAKYGIFFTLIYLFFLFPLLVPLISIVFKALAGVSFQALLL